MSYGIASRDYLKRAQQCLTRNDCESLFYAAFEIRCGVEARMQEYLEVQEHISKKKRQGWQVAKLARNIENTFKLGDKDAVLIVRDRKTKEIRLEARYTPVKASLKKKAEKLGNILHNAKIYHVPEDGFWLKLRSDLEEAIVELEHANSGRLLGPLLLHPNKKNIDMKLELPTVEEQEKAKQFATGENVIMEITYE